MRVEVSSSNLPRFDRNSIAMHPPSRARASLGLIRRSFTQMCIRRTESCRSFRDSEDSKPAHPSPHQAKAFAPVGGATFEGVILLV